MLNPTTKTDILKMAVSMAVALKSERLITSQLEERTDLDIDSLTVKVGAMCAGQLIGVQTRPHTDKAVDYAIAKIVAWKNRKQTAE